MQHLVHTFFQDRGQRFWMALRRIFFSSTPAQECDQAGSALRKLLREVSPKAVEEDVFPAALLRTIEPMPSAGPPSRCFPVHDFPRRALEMPTASFRQADGYLRRCLCVSW
jgi:hypothetical protein